MGESFSHRPWPTADALWRPRRCPPRCSRAWRSWSWSCRKVSAAVSPPGTLARHLAQGHPRERHPRNLWGTLTRDPRRPPLRIPAWGTRASGPLAGDPASFCRLAGAQPPKDTRRDWLRGGPRRTLPKGRLTAQAVLCALEASRPWSVRPDSAFAASRRQEAGDAEAEPHPWDSRPPPEPQFPHL